MTGDDDTVSDAPGAPPPWLEEIVETACALRELAGAQWQLLRAELRLARAAALLLLIVMVMAATTAMALGLAVLALLGVAFAYWFGSWILSLAALVVLLILALAAALIVARRCLHWLSLPGVRAQWHSLTHRPVMPSPAPDIPGFDMETSHEDNTSQADSASQGG